MTTQRPKVLFLTTQDPATIVAEWPYYQNWTLPQALEDLSVSVSKLNWRDPTTTSQKLATFDVISFLWCNDYHAHASAFVRFLQTTLHSAQLLSPTLRVVNDTSIILWNLNKETYLRDLAAQNYPIPPTTYIHNLHTQTLSTLTAHITAFTTTLPNPTDPIVLKPSISGSSRLTHLIPNPTHLTPSDKAYLTTLLTSPTTTCSSLLLQPYEPAIQKGEYSLIFIGATHTHTILKTPLKTDFRCQSEFGGTTSQIPVDQVPKGAIETANSVIGYLERKFPARGGKERGGAVYTRVDGVVRENGEFVIMEIEAIEPHLWLETADFPGGRELLYRALLGEDESEIESESEPVPVPVSSVPVSVINAGKSETDKGTGKVKAPITTVSVTVSEVDGLSD